MCYHNSSFSGISNSSTYSELSYLKFAWLFSFARLKCGPPCWLCKKYIYISLLLDIDHYWEIVGDHIVREAGLTAVESKLSYLRSRRSGSLLTQSETYVAHANATLAVNPNY